MASEHHFAARLLWTGAATGPTRTYEGYGRAWRAEVAGKPPLEGSADPVFRGDAARYNPEDLLVVALASCHMLSYLALCARAGIAVAVYEDQASGTMTRNVEPVPTADSSSISTARSVASWATSASPRPTPP